MNGKISIGVPVSTENLPSAFYKWFKEVADMYQYCTMEVKAGEIQIVRVRTPIDSIKAVEGLHYGKITTDVSGIFLERTFIPRYVRERDEIILEQ